MPAAMTSEYRDREVREPELEPIAQSLMRLKETLEIGEKAAAQLSEFRKRLFENFHATPRPCPSEESSGARLAIVPRPGLAGQTDRLSSLFSEISGQISMIEKLVF